MGLAVTSASPTLWKYECQCLTCPASRRAPHRRYGGSAQHGPGTLDGESSIDVIEGNALAIPTELHVITVRMTTRHGETGSAISCLLFRPTARHVAVKVCRQVRSTCRCRPDKYVTSVMPWKSDAWKK